MEGCLKGFKVIDNQYKKNLLIYFIKVVEQKISAIDITELGKGSLETNKIFINLTIFRYSFIKYVLGKLLL